MKTASLDYSSKAEINIILGGKVTTPSLPCH